MRRIAWVCVEEVAQLEEGRFQTSQPGAGRIRYPLGQWAGDRGQQERGAQQRNYW